MHPDAGSTTAKVDVGGTVDIKASAESKAMHIAGSASPTDGWRGHTLLFAD